MRFSLTSIHRGHSGGRFLLAFALAWLSLPSTGLAASNQASSNCHCEQYTSWLSMASLGSDIGDIGFRALHPDGRRFEILQEETDALRLQLFSNTLIPSECRAILDEKIRNRFTITVRRASESRDPKVRWQSLMENFVRYQKGMNQTPDGLAPEARIREFMKKPDQEIARSLIGVDGETLPSPAEIKLFRLYVDGLFQTNSKDLKNYLSGLKSKLTTQEKLGLVQAFGTRFLLDYSHERMNIQSPLSQGVVQFDDLLKAGRNNTLEALEADWQAGARQAIPGGVCRDIAAAQTEMLSALGMKDNYVLTYETSGGAHASLLTRDPANPKTVYKIDYGTLTAAEGVEGGRALFQGGKYDVSDVSLGYRIYSAKDGLVAMTQSEFGKFMTEVSGFDIRSVDPLGRPNSDVAAVTLGRGADAKGQLRLFQGTDGVGSDYLGVAGTQDLSSHPLAPSKVGGAVGTRYSTSSVNGTDRTYRNNYVFVQAEQKLNSPDLKLAQDRVRVRSENKVTAIAGVNDLKDIEPSKLSFQYDMIAETGVRAEHEQGPWKSSLHGAVQIVPAWKDIRRNDNPFAGTVAKNLESITAESRVRLSEQQRIYAAGLAMAVCGSLGCRGRAELAATYERIAISVAAQGRINDDMPPFLEGTERRIVVEVKGSVPQIPNVRFDVTGYQSLEDRATGVNATIQVNRF